MARWNPSGKPGLGISNFGSVERIVLESTRPFRTIKRVLNGSKRVALAFITYPLEAREFVWSSMRLVVAMLVLAALAGCSSGLSSRLTRVPSASGGEPLVPTKSVSPTNAPMARSTDRASTGIAARQSTSHDEALLTPSTNSAHTPNGIPWSHDWVSLESWSRTNDFGTPQRLGSAINLTYELRTAAGVVALTAGSALARLNGVRFW